jgi:hypothetical protein
MRTAAPPRGWARRELSTIMPRQPKRGRSSIVSGAEQIATAPSKPILTSCADRGALDIPEWWCIKIEIPEWCDAGCCDGGMR